MKRQSVWKTGIFLMPHHFQAQDQFVREELSFQRSIAAPLNWGFCELAINPRAIANRSFEIEKCSGFFDDGCGFKFPTSDPPVDNNEPAWATQPIPDVGKDGLEVYVAVPNDHAHKFRELDVDYIDEYDGTKESIRIRVPNLRIVFGRTAAGGHKALQVARLQMNGSAVQFDSTFIPPCLSLEASIRLKTLLWKTDDNGEPKVDSLLDLLTDARVALNKARSELSRDLMDISRSQLEQLLLLPIVNQALSELRHMSDLKFLHPEQAYRFGRRLAGALYAFSLDADIENVAQYDHGNLGICFGDLHKKLQEILKGIIRPEDKRRDIPLTQKKEREFERTWVGEIPAGVDLETCEVYVSFGAKKIDIVKFVEKQNVKLCGPNDYKQIREIPDVAIKLDHVPMRKKPSGLPYSDGAEYFRVIPDGKFWNDLKNYKNPKSKKQEIWIYITQDLDAPVIKLFALLP